MKNKRKGIEAIKRRYGIAFVAPWVFGVIVFVAVPIITTVLYSLSIVTVGSSGPEMKFVGFSNYYRLLFKNTVYVDRLAASLSSVFTSLPIIVSLSLILAIILNQNFKGRMIMRSIFFLPVIISSGVVITVLQENIMGSGISGNETTYLFKATSFETLLEGIGLPDKLMKSFTEIINQLFDLSWKSGVQILLLLAAVNNIPRSSYEAADMEGATEWEKFWKITFPTVSPTILVTVIYTVIDSFTDYSNSVMRLIEEQLNLGYYEYSSTMALVYFVCVLVIIGIVGGLISRKVYYQVD